MSYSQNGRDMDRLPGAGESVRRARERVAAGFQRTDLSQTSQPPRTREDEPQMAQPSMTRRPVAGPTAGQPRVPRLQAPPGLQLKDGQIGVAISRPTQVPQWPLPGPLTSLSGSSDSEPYRPPPGKSTQAPQRPPRPSRVPSMLDGSKIQDPTPSFQYRPQSGRESSGQELASVPETPSSLSRPSTVSSVGSIPDFPLPIPIPVAPPPRRSVNLGPPPSARRGASSFYSNASFVSPIPEESPRSRSHVSFASSAAMPESWGTPSPGPSPNYPEPSYEDIIADQAAGGSGYEDDAEESQLVRSASVGKRGKPTLVSTTTPRAFESGESSQRPAPTPIQSDPFKNGTGYVENSSSSSGTLPMSRAPVPRAITTDSMLDAYNAASATDPSNPPTATPSPQPRGGRPYSRRLSAIWRGPPPQSDPDIPPRTESRASLTSLPDLIRRATRLAATLEMGRRPASRFDDLTDSSGADLFGRYDKELSVDGEKHQSGLSDMLAAFPPPGQPGARRSFRESLRQQVASWPLPLNTNNRGRGNDSSQEDVSSPGTYTQTNKRRRICGLTMLRFIILFVIALIIVVAAVVIPLQFFVFRKRNAAEAQPSLQKCLAQLNCSNGGTNVVKQGVCSCICTGGFTGFDCTLTGATGCTTTSLTGETNIDNVTLGDAIPRLIQAAQSNFSISLSPTTILAKLNAGNLSCSAENALVTFDGQPTRQGDASSEVTDSSGAVNALNVDDGVEVKTITVSISASSTVTLKRAAAAEPSAEDPSLYHPAQVTPRANKARADAGFTTLVVAPDTLPTIFATTISFGNIPPQITRTSTTTTTTTISAAPGPSATFAAVEETLDFARVAVLFILQEKSLNDAESAQVTLQRFFSTASAGRAAGGGGGGGGGVDVGQARNVSLGNGNSVDLVNFRVDTGKGARGGRSSGAARRRSVGPRPVPVRVLHQRLGEGA